MARNWRGSEIPALRAVSDRVAGPATLAAWLDRTEQSGIDPL
jgi:hypothetical protein